MYDVIQPLAQLLRAASHMKTGSDLRRRLLAVFGALCLLALGCPAFADTLLGKVVGVSDGDSITVLDAEKVTHKVRLVGIDAPEGGQAFGQVSKRHLSDLVYSKQVRIEWDKVDRYQRKLGKVFSENQDVCLAQVKAGLAWHFKQYQRDQSPEDREKYSFAETEAKRLKLGLWRDAEPLAPWDWRKEKKQKAAQEE
jgi:endonuclease YncB( thermonuclease family)